MMESSKVKKTSITLVFVYLAILARLSAYGYLLFIDVFKEKYQQQTQDLQTYDLSTEFKFL